MEQRMSFVTLAVRDVEASARFYVAGLGWVPELHLEGEILMLKVAERVILSLWSEAGFEEEVGPIRRGSGVVPITLAHNCHTVEQVDQVLVDADRAGGTPIEAGRPREWGGYSGYFADPDGYRWEVAVNPGPTGALVLPPHGGTTIPYAGTTETPT
jgi:uncharacterized protein